MAIQKISKKKFHELIRAHWSAEEWPATVRLMEALQPASERGWLSLKELEQVCYWKSPRAIHHIRANSATTVKKITRMALLATDEVARMDLLQQLKGVSFPMASALLTLLQPAQYGVIDIRVWQVLAYMGWVKGNPAGVQFTMAQWIQFLGALRALARHHQSSVRDVERTLFLLHATYKEGLLYGK
jgi:thermostable 8-oxoguanine DNA glycosylase